MKTSDTNPYQATDAQPLSNSQIPNSEFIQGVLRTSQVIVFALAAGLICFAGYAFFAQAQNLNGGGANFDTLVKLGLGMALLALPASFVVPVVISSSQVAGLKGNEDAQQLATKLLSIYQSQLIVGCALLEGPGFFNIYAFMRERNPISLATAGLAIALILVRMPTADRIKKWLAKRLPA